MILNISKWWRDERTYAWIVVAGMLMVGSYGMKRRIYERSLRLPVGINQAYAAETTVVNMGQLPTSISVEGKVDAVVEVAVQQDGSFWISEAGATYLMETARLGSSGNAIVYGHNNENLLGGLKKVVVGDEVVMKGKDGKDYVYEVEVVQAVSPDDTEWLVQTEGPVLTVYTCTGFLDSQRWVVRARLVDE